MNRSRLFLSLVALLTLAATAVYEARAIAQRREKSEALEKSLLYTQQQLLAQRAALELTLQDLSTARRQLDDLATLIKPSLTASEPAREAEVQAWLSRLKKIRELFADDASQHIPELRFLNDTDWLRASRRIQLDDDEQRREALASVRGIAKEKFVQELAAALKKFTTAHHGQLPSNLSELTAYFSAPLDPAILLRYALVESGPGNPFQKSPAVILEKAPIDPDHDTRPFILANGGLGSMTGPEAWIENFQSLRARAVEAYASANRGAFSQKFSDLIPYLNPPLPPATVEKILAAERKRTR